MAARVKVLAAFSAVLASVCFFAGLAVSTSAGATPALICTWTGATNNDLSVANNWNPNSGQTCGGSASTVNSAELTNAELVFPATVPAGGSMLSLDAPESVDDLVFDNGYVISGSSTLTLSPSANGSLGIDASSGEQRSLRR